MVTTALKRIEAEPLNGAGNLWRARKGMPQHYAVAQIREIHDALEHITDERHGWNRTLASIQRDQRVPVKLLGQRKRDKCCNTYPVDTTGAPGRI